MTRRAQLLENCGGDRELAIGHAWNKEMVLLLLKEVEKEETLEIAQRVSRVQCDKNCKSRAFCVGFGASLKKLLISKRVEFYAGVRLHSIIRLASILAIQVDLRVVKLKRALVPS